MKIAHNSMHQGSDGMETLIVQYYWWPKYYKDCKQYCKYCDSYQNMEEKYLK